ncbi:MAG TPA: GAF domain-containing SpoIIE family protein phosphatase [Chthoniobacterales bacterium]
MSAPAPHRLLKVYKGLVEVSALINSITDFRELLHAILNVAREVFQTEAASLFIANEETGELELLLACNETGYQEPQIVVPSGRGVAGWVWQRHEPALIRDAYADPRFYPEADRQTGFHTRSILCVPLKRIGVLQLLNPASAEDSDLEALQAYAALTATAIEKLRALRSEHEQALLQRDLKIAAEIQEELLAHAIPQDLPHLHCFNEPAQNVGGDFYFAQCLPDGGGVFAIGDVSGKGIPAALLMSQILNSLEFVFHSSCHPAEALQKLNALLHPRIIRGMFATLLLGRYQNGSVELASAGHCQPLLLRKGTATEITVSTTLPIGVLPSIEPRSLTLPLPPGAILLAYTDGLSESRDPASDHFLGDDLKTLLSRPFANPRQVVDFLVDTERHHRRSQPRADDLTILAFQG